MGDWVFREVQGVLGCSGFFQVTRDTENFLGALGENLGLAGVVLLLNRRDKRRFLFFCYASRQTNVGVKILTLREVLTKRRCILKARQWFGTSDKGLSYNLDELRIH